MHRTLSSESIKGRVYCKISLEPVPMLPILEYRFYSYGLVISYVFLITQNEI